MNLVEARCAKCREWMKVSPLASSFPAGPFFCEACRPKARREGEPGRPEDDGGPLAVGEETGEDAIVIEVSGRLGK